MNFLDGPKRWVSFPCLCWLLLLAHTDVGHAQSVLKQREQAIQAAAAAVNDSIVRIETVGGIDLVGDVLTGTGPTSGVVVSEDGFILTSRFNFAGNPASVLVTLPSGDSFAARVIANDHAKMLTLLKIETSGLTPIRIAAGDQIRVGQTAIALGRTFDRSFPNLSVGIVSALNRVQGKAIQTDAKCSPVNYGGPLVNLRGECLGIIVPLSPQQEGETAGVEWYDSGIGFAIPMSEIVRVLDRLKGGEELHPGRVGVGFEQAGPLSGAAKVIRVRPQSPADQAGLQVGDVITRIDGQPVRRLIDLQQILGNRYAGEAIELEFERDNQTIIQQVELVSELLAFQLTSIGFVPARYADIEQPGVPVHHVFEESGAATAGLQRGDRVIEFNGDPIESAAEIALLLSATEPGQTVEFTVTRGEQAVHLSVKLQPFPDGDGATNLPPQPIPQGNRPEEIKIGRFNQQLPGSDRSFWVHVPQTYVPGRALGLLVWVHPAGETREAEMMRLFGELSQERGIILVGPRAEDLSGWSETDEQHLRDVVQWVREQYSVDPTRIAIMGLKDSGTFATGMAFQDRDLFRGLIAFESPLRMPPPDNDPDHRLLIAMVGAPQTRQRERIEKSVELLRSQKFPTALIDAEEEATFSIDLVNSLVQWLDTLDRL